MRRRLNNLMARISAASSQKSRVSEPGSAAGAADPALQEKPPRQVRLFQYARSAVLALLPICVAGLIGCGGGSPHNHNGVLASTAAGSPIQHVVIIMQENRTFDNLFHGFPGADSASTGMKNGVQVTLAPLALDDPHDLGHAHTDWWQDWDNGKMDGFAHGGSTIAYSYVPSNQIQPYWTLAQQYALGDRMFESNTGPSFPAHE
jgi:phospholipase C